METYVYRGVEFRPNRSKKNMLTLYIVLFLVMGLCLIPIIVGLQDSEIEMLNFDDKVGAGAFLFACCLGFFLIAHFLTSPFNIHYFVGSEGVTLKAFTTTLLLPYGEIESITHIPEKQSEQILMKGWNRTRGSQAEEINSAINNGDDLSAVFSKVKATFKAQRKWFSPYKFLSVAIAFIGSRNSQIANRADLPCDTVAVLLKDGGVYFISPLDIPGFMNETKKYFSA